MSEREQSEEFKERMQASKLKINGQVILGRANYQLRIEDSIRTLDKDVERLSRLGKTRIDALDDMERRLKRMRSQLKTAVVPTVTDRVAFDLYQSNKKEVENKFTVCTRCQRKILTALMEVHDLACARLQSADTKYLGLRPVPNVGEEVQALIDEHATFPPQPPRRCRVKEKGTSYIVWEWDKPVYEGGWPVIDYEISYVANVADWNKAKKRYDRYREVCPSLSTSNWCFAEPISHHGYTMVGLRAATEYAELMIRCRNNVGWSDWVAMVAPEEEKYDPFAALGGAVEKKKRRKTPGVFTNPAEPPSPPLFFICTRITTSCAHVCWDTPFYDGGLPIVEYHVHYTVMEHCPTATDRERVEERPNRVKVRIKTKEDQRPGATITFIIRNLPADTDVVDVVVKAMNKGDLISEGAALTAIHEPGMDDENASQSPTKVKARGADLKMRKNVRAEGRTGNQAAANAKDKALQEAVQSGKRGIIVHTKVASRHMQLVEQVRQAELATDKYIDTDFYTGITQRLVRAEFIAQLQADIRQNPIAPEEAAEQEEWLAHEVARRKRRDDEEAERRRIQAEIDANERAMDKKYGETDKILFEEADDDSKSLEDRFMFPFQQRRAHFTRRIALLEKELTSLSEERAEIDSNRSRLTKFMQEMQIKQVGLRMERDRVAAFDGEVVTSSVLHGALMQYEKEDFLGKVTDSLEETSTNIASSKFAVIKDATRRKEIKSEVVAIEARLQERRAAFMDFTKVFEKSVKAAELLRSMKGGQGVMHGGSVVSDVSDDTANGPTRPSGKNRPLVTQEEYMTVMSWSLDMWRDFIAAKRHFDRSLEVLFQHLRLRCLRFALSKWRTGKFFEADDGSGAGAGGVGRVAKPISLGGVLLKSAQEEREDLQSDLRALLADANVLKQRIHLVTIGKESRAQLVRSEEYDNMDEGLSFGKMSRRSQEIVNRAYQAMREAKAKADWQELHKKGLPAKYNPVKIEVVHQGDNTALMRYLYEGDGYTAASKFDNARRAYENQILMIRANPTLNVKLLALCHGRLGRLFIAMGKFDRAIVDFGRQMSLGKEIDDEPEVAEANYGIGQAYMMCFDFSTALIYLGVAQSLFTALRNLPKLCAVMRTMQACFKRLGREELIQQYDERLEQVDGSMARKLQSIGAQLKDMQGRLMGNSTGVASEFVVNIERTTLRAIALKTAIVSKEEEIADLNTQLESQLDTVQRYEKILRAIDREIKIAEETDEVQMISYMIMSTPQLADVEEVKTRLAVRKDEEKENLRQALQGERALLTKVANAREDIRLNQEELDIEEGRLMQRMSNHKPFRTAAFCRFNARGNEVTGTASEGVEWYVAAEGANIHCLDYYSGEVLHVMIGNDKHDIAGAVTGHSGLVTCLVHDGALLFSGGTDEWIISWDSQTKELLKVFYGHEGGITALACSDTMLASAAADTTIRLWNKTTAEMIRVVHGHSKSVLTLEMGEEWMCSAGADEEVRVWTITPSGRHSMGITCKHRLVGHEVPVTCVRYGDLEVMSGDSLGRVFLWWTATGSRSKPPYVIHKIQVHAGPVRCMQFDAVYIVSGGADGTMCITDIATGEVMQTIRAHIPSENVDKEGDEDDDEDDDEEKEVDMSKLSSKARRKALREKLEKDKAGEEKKTEEEEEEERAEKLEALAVREEKRRKRIGTRSQVVAVAFDSNRIISVGTDDTMRYWSWGKKEEAADKFHVLSKGETLVSVSKKHDIDIQDLMKWNGISEANHVYVGMKLIVRKGDPDEPTAAERLVAGKEFKKKAGLAYTNTKLQELTGSYGLNKKSQVFKTRTQRLADNDNKESAGNRMFLKAKYDRELFPDPQDTYKDPRGIVARLNRFSAAQAAASVGAPVVVESGPPNRAPEAPPEYYMSHENAEEWGPVADGLLGVMLGMMVEYEAYDVAREADLETKATYAAGPQSLQGRLYKHNEKVRQALAEEQAAKERAEREEQDKLRREMAEIADRERAQREVEARLARIEEGQGEMAGGADGGDIGNEEEEESGGGGGASSASARSAVTVAGDSLDHDQ